MNRLRRELDFANQNGAEGGRRSHSQERGKCRSDDGQVKIGKLKQNYSSNRAERDLHCGGGMQGLQNQPKASSDS